MATESDPSRFAPPGDDGERTMIRVPRSRITVAAPRTAWVHDLVYTDEAGAVQRQRLQPGVPVRIGRRAPAELQFRDAEVSGLHCELLLRDDELVVTDRGSTNGTFVDGRRIHGPEPVPHGGVLQVGKQTLKHEFRDEQELVQSQELDRDLARASHYVQSLLPQPLTRGPVQVQWHYQPSARVGGDAFGYHHLDEHRLVLYLADVSGHGVGAAMHGVAVFNTLRQQSLPGVDFADPSQVLARLNDQYPMDGHGGMFFTIWYGVLDLRTLEIEFAAAGQHPAYVARPGHDGLLPLVTRNLVIGAMPGMAYTKARAQLARGDRLYLFSDGVFEIVTREGLTWQIDHFLPLLGRSAASVADGGASEAERLHHDVRGLARPGPLDDDFSLVVAQLA
ncbi:MAG: PP2C family protein-serine/threonine phosphatase [Betaproteobacteria bacterium]